MCTDAANSKLGFMKIHTLNGGLLNYSTPCRSRPATQVSKADPKGQIIWPYTSTIYGVHFATHT